MARYLSPEWFEDVNAAAPQRPATEDAARPAHLTLQQVVTGSPDGDVRYWVSVGGGQMAAGLGEADDPDATISQSYQTAVAVVTGQLRVQTALMSGQIRLAGDIGALIEHQEALHGLDTALAGVLARTSY